MQSNFQIRDLQKTDAKGIKELSNELGYSLTLELVEKQIQNLLADRKHYAYVAMEENKLLGYIHGILSIRLTSPPFLEICGLVVNEAYRNKGIGRKLVKRLEFEASDQYNMRVRCNIKRASAHSFYKNLKFKESKKQIVFELKRDT